MTDKEPSRPYVYQPFGAITHPEEKAAGRLWGVAGVSIMTTIRGLTKTEAESVLAALTETEAAAANEETRIMIQAACGNCGQGGNFVVPWGATAGRLAEAMEDEGWHVQFDKGHDAVPSLFCPSCADL